MSKVTRVVIVDDHKLIRSAIRHLLNSSPNIKVVAEGGSGEEALELVKTHKPDVVLLDLYMPGIGGYEATRKIKRFHEATKIIIISSCDEELFPKRLIDAGASGYLTKGSDSEEMLTAIAQVMKGEYYISRDVAQSLALSKVSPAAGSPFKQLSERELQIALMLAQGVKVQLISEQLILSTKTICTYRYRIYEKLNIENDVELAFLAIRYNLIEPSGQLKEQPEK